MNGGRVRCTMAMGRTSLLFLLFGMNACTSAEGADLLVKLRPSISLQVVYSDNTTLSATNKKESYIATVSPGITYSNMGTKSGIEIDYLFGLVMDGKNSNMNYVSHNGVLNAKYVTPGHVTLYLREFYTRSSEPRERAYPGAAADNGFVTAINRDRAVFWRNVLAPTVEYQFGPENRLGLRYRNNMYRTDSPAGQDSQEDYINPFISYWFDRQNGLSLDYGLTLGHFERTPNMTGHRVNALYTHRFHARASVFAEFTFSRRAFASPGLDYDVYAPDAGITYAFSPTLLVSARAGYYAMDPGSGSKRDGFTYRGNVINRGRQTTYEFGIQGGYGEDFFTAENLGFRRFNRLTGSLEHHLDRRTSIALSGSLERSDYDSGRSDTVWGAGGTATNRPLKWLTLAAEVSHMDNRSNVSASEYSENRGMVRITAAY